MNLTGAAYWAQPTFVEITWRSGQRSEQAFPNRRAAEAFLTMIPWAQTDWEGLRQCLQAPEYEALRDGLPDVDYWRSIARAILRPANLSLN